MPAPPYASGIGAPRNPCSAIFAKSSCGNPPSSSQRRMFGRISASAKARADCWTRRFSSVSAKSTMDGMLIGRPRRGGAQPYTRPMDELTSVADLAARATHLSPVLGRYFERSWSHGVGHRLYDTAGRGYLDFANGIAVTALGHAHPRVTAAIHAQADRLIGPTGAIGYSEPVVTLASMLAATFPDPIDTVMFLNSGSEAIDGALKLARRVTGRPGIVAFRGGFHGRTFGATSITTSNINYRTGYEPLLPGIYFAPFPAAYRDFGGDEAAATDACLAAVRSLFETVIAPTSVAAVVIEPVQGEGGYTPAPAAFLQGLRAI